MNGVNEVDKSAKLALMPRDKNYHDSGRRVVVLQELIGDMYMTRLVITNRGGVKLAEESAMVFRSEVELLRTPFREKILVRTGRFNDELAEFLDYEIDDHNVRCHVRYLNRGNFPVSMIGLEGVVFL